LSGIAADFQRDDILRWLPVAATRGERFERVFASYGTLVWLSDLKRWADGIAQVLVPGGRFVLVEFHPFALYFDPHWQPAYDYFSREPIAESGVSDYVAESGASLAPSGYRAGVENFSNPHPSYEFQWGLADVIGALLGAGLQLERLEEYPYANGWAGFDGMRD
ncbi:SAM-dependent methyltransferase, partial [Pseudomonas aeruginosa]|nr:SAM-dependent methyltransferase [Pseudomonas aeruginosa]